MTNNNKAIEKLKQLKDVYEKFVTNGDTLDPLVVSAHINVTISFLQNQSEGREVDRIDFKRGDLRTLHSWVVEECADVYAQYRHPARWDGAPWGLAGQHNHRKAIKETIKHFAKIWPKENNDNTK